jgi:SHS2 domain-containing protein
MENKNYKILAHPADVKVRAFGKTKEELFLNAMKGMSAVLKVKSKKLKVKRKISVKSLDLNALLVDFLSEVLYLSQVNKEIYSNIKFNKFEDKELGGELIGN